ncbi:zinc-binding metallopeptidase family protein [Algoriphagus halophytocola]|uniref:Zinc-binding peptidase n=1 Tax=Algoriphagus halophytocola TaxID=2991499 RepID=A0ABY6MD15_9BACT|nr:putative zinc-binding peptidase [Algoriphagus sp. TR-M5]UZD21612.1 putative zinc-binding peptidase [Algoriphagus sp. TR-M5]
MKIFECGNCGNPLFFENDTCENCGHLVGYNPTEINLMTFDPAKPELVSDHSNLTFKHCSNHQYGVCNWVVPAQESNEFCEACALNNTIPDLSDAENFPKWQKLEVAKHRLVYQLNRFKLSASPKEEMSEGGLCFDFLSRQGDDKIMTGHANGVITILLAEADSVHREQMRKQMSEPYRTLIGHFRHEVGHYYWDQLIAQNQRALNDFREIFGNEQADYSQALQTYYQHGPKQNWQNQYISQYATAHPWEDWAETWAHYLHIMDMAETAYYYGIGVSPKINEKSLQGTFSFDPYTEQNFNKIYESWAPISFAINSLNRSMGVPDAYPFVVSRTVISKMKFIHQLIYEL